jgi:hypothetical protein
MKPEIKEFLIKYNESHGYSTDDDMLIETVIEGKTVFERLEQSHRWWDEWFKVVNVGEKDFGFIWARTTGDMSAREAGWEFDSDSIVEVKPVIKTVTEWVPL